MIITQAFHRQITIEKIVRIIWICSLLIFAGITFYSLSPQFTIHHYRQAQTAMTALYLPYEGFKLNYSTPIMGYPWTVPLEFPIFQWLSILVQKISGADLIVSGKTINILCHISNNLLIIQILKRYQIDWLLIFSGLIFYNLSPYYLVFDTVFLIDSFSLTLCFTSIYFLSKFLQNEKELLNGFLFFLFAFLTGLSKSTTFVGVLGPITAVLLIHHLLQQGGFKKLFSFSSFPIRKIYAAAILFLLSFTIMYLWVSYTDGIKLLNPLAAQWTSANTASWNFGTLQQRLTFANWKQYFSFSMLAHPIFYLLLAAGYIAFFIYSDHKEKIFGLCLFLFFIAPLLFFFNLFFIHTYYSIANHIFLCFLIGLPIAILMKQKTIVSKSAGIVLGATLLLFTCYRSYAFRNQILKNAAEPGVYAQLNKLNFRPDKNDVIVVVQTSRDPFIEYFFKCRGINLNQAEYEAYGKADRLQNLAGGLPIKMICIVDEKQLQKLPSEFSGILPDAIKHLALSHQPESANYYNFFWY